MALKNELNSLDFSDQEKIKSFLGKLVDKIEYQDTIINSLEHENSNLREKQESLEELVNELGRYSSKNCLTFLGLLPMEDKNPLSAVLNLLNKGLGLPIQAQDIGACHFLPSDYSVKPIIVRFIYDHQREFVWNAREDIRQLTGSSNRPVRVVQRLTEKDRDVLNYANSNKLIVTTNKGKVLVKKSSTDQSWKYMKSRKDVDLLTWANSQNTSSSNVTPAEAAPTGNPLKHKYVSTQNHYNRTSSYANLESKLDTMIDKMSSFIEAVNGSGFSPPSKRIRNEASTCDH